MFFVCLSSYVLVWSKRRLEEKMSACFGLVVWVWLAATMPSLLVQSFSGVSFSLLLSYEKLFLYYAEIMYVFACGVSVQIEEDHVCFPFFVSHCFIPWLFSLRWRWSFSFMAFYLSSHSVPSFILLKQIWCYNEFYLTFISQVAVAESIWKIMTANE